MKKHGREWKLIQELSYNTRSRNDLKNRYSILTRRRRDSLSTQGAARRQANSPSASAISSPGDYCTPGKGLDEDGDFGMTPEGVPMQDLEAGDYVQDPAYTWGGAAALDDNWFNSTHIGPDSTLDAMNPDSASTTGFSSPEYAVLGEVDSTGMLYGGGGGIASTTTQQQFPWDEEALYDDLLDLNTPPHMDVSTPDTAQTQGCVITGPNETFGENSKRRVSLVVDECDWTTLNYLLDVTKPLKGKVQLEMNL